MARKRSAKKEQEAVMLKVSSAFVLDGEVVKKGELIETTDAEARRLLARGKVELATDDEVKPAGKGGKQE